MSDNVKRMALLLYGRDATPQEFLGGADAKILADGCAEIERLQAENEKLTEAVMAGVEWRQKGILYREALKQIAGRDRHRSVWNHDQMVDTALKALENRDQQNLCHHEYFDPTNCFVQGNGYKICNKCGDVKPPDQALENRDE